MYFQVNEDHNQGVMIKDFRSGCRSTNKLLQVYDLIHTIEGTSLMDMPINKVIEVLERSRGRNTEVTIGFHHMINMNLEINQSRVRQLLPQRYIDRSDEGVYVEKQPFTGNHYHNVLVLGDGTYSITKNHHACSIYFSQILLLGCNITDQVLATVAKIIYVRM